MTIFKYKTHILLASLMLVWADLSCAGALHAFIKDQDGKPVEDAVVLATPLGGNQPPLPRRSKEEVDQIDKEYVPHVKVVMLGSRVYFPNKDNIRHHVYSFSPAKVFELPLYTGTPTAPVLFDKAGPVTLGCNIHDWMLGYIYVADTPYFAKSAKDGQTRLADLPPGEYSVRVWHPDMKGEEETTIRKVKLDAAEATNAEWQLTLKPVFRIPRTSGTGGAAY